MCWDRFDDAMDDLNDDIHEYKKEADGLEAQLAKLGYTDYKRPQKFYDKKYSEGNYMQEAYGDNQGLWHEWQDYIKLLKEKLKELKNKKNTNS